MLGFVCRNSERVIFNSDNLKNRLLAILPDLDSLASVIYPCPENMFYQKPADEIIMKLKSQYALEGKKVILSVGRLTEGKGFTHFIRILPKILEKEPHLVWLVVGDGSKKTYLWQEIQKHNLQNVVRFVGVIPHEELNKFYYLADLVVLLTHPDEGREAGLGLVFLEAAAAGLPVIAGKSGGVEEAVIHAETGILVDIYKGDKAVVDSIVQMLHNKDFATRLAENAYSRVKSNFKWENQLKVLDRWI